MTQPSYSDRSAAMRGAKRAGLDPASLAICRNAENRWTWSDPVRLPSFDALRFDDVEPAADDDADLDLTHVAGLVVGHDGTMRPPVEVDLTQVVEVEEAAIAAPPVEVEPNPWLADATLSELVDDQLSEMKTRPAALTLDDTMAAFRREEAEINPTKCYTISFSIERDALHLAMQSAREIAKKLGYAVLVTTPDNEQFAAAGRMKAVKSATKNGKLVRTPAERRANPRTVSKDGPISRIIEALKRPRGATLSEIGTVCGWAKPPGKSYLIALGRRHKYTIEALTPMSHENKTPRYRGVFDS